MADPRVVKGASVPLFDRLIDLTPNDSTELRVLRHLSVDELRSSIRRELERILATKRAISMVDSINESDRTVLQYGVPDYTDLSPRDPIQQTLFARALEVAFAAFEPRLTSPRVRVERHADQPNSLHLVIEGRMQVGDHSEDVWFPINITPKAQNSQAA